MYIVPFHPDHLGEALYQGASYGTLQDQNAFLDFTNRNGGGSIAFTAYNNNTILGMGGFIELYPHLAEAWVIVLTNNNFSTLKIARNILKLFNKVANDYPRWERIQAAVQSDFDKGIRLIEFLGFENEGLMKKFGPDKQDYYRYAMVRNGPN